MALKIYSLVRLNNMQINYITDNVSECEVICVSSKDIKHISQDVNVILGYDIQLDMPLIMSANHKKLQWIHTYSAGVDNILSCMEFIQSDILLTNSRGIHGIPMAEHILGIMLNHSRCFDEARINQKKHQWAKLTNPDELYARTVTIIGLGSIGKVVAKYLSSIGMRVLAVKRELTLEPFVEKIYDTKDLHLALQEADYIVATVPLTEETKNLFNKHTFSVMKPTAYFINVSRGAIVKEDDLMEALNNGVIGGAALDVFLEEPLSPTSPLWNQDNLFITPHTSATSPQYIDRSLKIFVSNLKMFPKSEHFINLVDKQRGY